ncbi:endonuclease domain-containing protein [Spirosoma agri]|uniref:Endonuclease domain-containing protein n=1 Tax=Spirosoma agri TaxID=1987381 RepID=A0A6M0IFV1_9BACT|nr:endonuclease domain-containing protein [Spirosoma agri]NEU66702.1 endonuclease domain-containing protein [Spirosoma agri]
MIERVSNDPLIKELRRELRQNQTQAEDVLWEELRGRRLADTKFRRQHSLGYFIVDFYCAEYKLVIEVDGAVHNTLEAHIKDAEREAVLCDLGLTILRFTNDDVLYTMGQVIKKIHENLQ